MKTPTRIKKQLLFVSLWFAFGVSWEANAQGVIIDQSLQPPPRLSGVSYHYDSSIVPLRAQTGQEFTPTFPGLDFVDVVLFGSAAVTSFQILLHEGSIDAPVIATSGQINISPGGNPSHLARFLFPSRVPLIVENVYVMEIIQNGGFSGWGIEIPISAIVNQQAINMNYSRGRLIYEGVPQTGQDLLFQEGIIIAPEPTAFVLCILGVLAFGRRKVLSKT